MRKPKTYYATRGYLTAEGASKTEAKANLEIMIDFACRNGTPKVESRFGLILIVAATANGYTHTIVDPAEMTHGKDRHCNTTYPQGHYTDALEGARSHAAQWAWNADVADDETFVTLAGLTPNKASELRSWINFQRSYIALKAQGASDAEAHARAGGCRLAA